MMSTSFSLAEIFLLIFLQHYNTNIAGKKTRMSSRYENDENNKRNEMNFKWLLMVKTDTSPFPLNTTWLQPPPPVTRPSPLYVGMDIDYLKFWNNTQLIYESDYPSKCNLLAFCTSSKYAKTSLSVMYTWLGTLKRKPIDDSGVALDASAPFYEGSFEVICRHFLHPNKRWIMDNMGLVSVVDRSR